MTRDYFIRKHLSSFLTDKHRVMSGAEQMSQPVGLSGDLLVLKIE